MDIRKKRKKEESEDREGGREGGTEGREKIGGGDVNKKRRKI